jgi:hypothetical protein
MKRKVLFLVSILLVAFSMVLVFTYPKRLPEAEGCPSVCMIYPKGTQGAVGGDLVATCDSSTKGCDYCCSYCVQRGADVIVGNPNCGCTIAGQRNPTLPCPA